MTTARRSILLVLAASVLFGTSGTAQALGPVGSTPLGVGIIRIATGALALVVAMPLLGERPRALLGLWRTRPMLVTALTASLYQVLFFAGVSIAGVALGTLVAVGSAPVFAGAVGWVVLGHRPTRGWAAATVVCVSGLVLLAAPSILARDGLATGAVPGFLLAVGAGLCVPFYNTAARIQMDRGVTPLAVPAGSFALGGIVLLPLLATQPLGWLLEPSGIALALYLGVATMAIANTLLARGIRGLSAGPVVTLMLADPVVATLLGVFVLHETLTVVEAAGVAALLGGLVLQSVVAAREDEEAEPFS
jgi:DME family drug/metabolite transporter